MQYRMCPNFLAKGNGSNESLHDVEGTADDSPAACLRGLRSRTWSVRNLEPGRRTCPIRPTEGRENSGNGRVKTHVRPPKFQE